jgi:transposase
MEADMDRVNFAEFFLNPMHANHRRYEALRSHFVDEISMQDVAQRFGVSYGTMRNWVSEFCSYQSSGSEPPFLFSPRVVGLVTIPQNNKLKRSMSQTSKRFRLKQDVE